MAKERIPVAGNILAIARSKAEQAEQVADVATSYMPTNIDLDKLMPFQAADRQANSEPDTAEPQAAVVGSEDPSAAKPTRKAGPVGKAKAKAKGKADSKPARERKRISLYLEDDVLTRIFQVSLQHREQMSSATHRLIIEALEARGL
ncbi:hypothetical protein [Ensifer sp. LCM 4579]|uniref:hypothetical protein n=1 Tax=Ensifer sp. LCM 4579 TaxID=1848292 RepID=UPI0008D972BC|nr:hypothetical protein [Ensifer sp. LCM 4579]OHV80376.1 hypothetical protein LCM4579_22590 [Ensifer sp. LCM 4579]